MVGLEAPLRCQAAQPEEAQRGVQSQAALIARQAKGQALRQGPARAAMTPPMQQAAA